VTAGKEKEKEKKERMEEINPILEFSNETSKR
jgi:hypothetical protein